MEWTKGRKVMAVIGGIAILFMIYGIVHFIIMNNQYNKVIEVIKQGDYTRAEENTKMIMMKDHILDYVQCFYTNVKIQKIWNIILPIQLFYIFT